MSLPRALFLSLFLALACSSPPVVETPALDTPTLETVQEASTQVLRLEMDEEHLRGPLAPGEVETFEIQAARGDFLHIDVMQEGIDVALTLLGPGGLKVAEVDGPAGRWSPEDLLHVAEDDGDYLLVAESLAWEAADRGRYRIRLEAREPASLEQRRLVQAEALLAQAGRLRYKAKTRNEALLRFDEAGRIFGELGDEPRRGKVLLGKALTFRSMRQDADAIQHFLQALAIFDASDAVDARQPYLFAQAHHMLGSLHRQRGEFAEAERSFSVALELQEKLGDQVERVRLFNNLGIVKTHLGEFQEALELYRKAVVGFEELGHQKVQATVLLNRGRCYSYLGDDTRALLDLQEAARIQGEQPSAAVLTALGQVHSKLDNFKQASKFFSEALVIRQRDKDRRGEAVTRMLIARTAALLGKNEDARRSLAEALPTARASGDQYLLAWTLLDLGTTLLDLGQQEEALPVLGEALLLLQNFRGRNGEVRARLALSQAHRALGDDGLALAHLREALALTEELRVKPVDHRLRSSFFATKQDVFDDAIDLLMELDRKNPNSGYAQEAFELSEQARARSLLDLLAENGPDLRRTIDPTLVERLRHLSDQLNQQEMLAIRLREAAGRPSQIEGIDRRIGEILRDLRIAEEELGRATGSNQAMTSSVADIQRQLGDTTLLAYRLGRSASYAWIVRSNAFHSFRLAARDVIERKAWRSYRLLAQVPKRETLVATELALNTLSEDILKPLVAELVGEEILVVADGALQYVPLSALPLPGPEGRSLPLVNDHKIIVMPSVSTFLTLRRQLAGRVPAPRRLAVIADPVFQSHDPRFASGGSATVPASQRAKDDMQRFERLVYSQEEAETILNLVPADSRFAALGFAANRDTVLSGELRHYRWLHFATHGDLNPMRPELSRLVLSLRREDGSERVGLLHAHEVYDLELAADLVVLSACRTALGKDVRGEGIVGLAQGFLYAGAARTVVSLWQVDDRATAELMGNFYRELTAGETPAAALRAAQVDIASKQRWQPPYYWAGFVLFGID